MEFTEKNIEQIKHALMPIIARFTHDVTAISIKPKKSFNGKEYLDIATNNIRMTPCVFPALCIIGEARIYKDDEGNESLWVGLSWRWKSFSGGSNGTELATIWMRKSFNGYDITDVRLR